MRRTPLAELIPDPQVLLELPIEHLAYQVLRSCASARQGKTFPPAIVVGKQGLFEPGIFGELAYPRNGAEEIELATSEAFEWLKAHILVMPAPSPNESYYRLTRRGEAILQDEDQFLQFVDINDFPRHLIHEAIRNDVWLQVSLNQWSTAVFVAFRGVEVAVRLAGNFAATDHGVPLMRRAFHKDSGPLSDMSSSEGEREVLASLFAGAIGMFKNPHSHHKVDDLTAEVARELIILASHLLRVVEASR